MFYDLFFGETTVWQPAAIGLLITVLLIVAIESELGPSSKDRKFHRDPWPEELACGFLGLMMSWSSLHQIAIWVS